jgi:hypothetical protein
LSKLNIEQGKFFVNENKEKMKKWGQVNYFVGELFCSLKQCVTEKGEVTKEKTFRKLFGFWLLNAKHICVACLLYTIFVKETIKNLFCLFLFFTV